MQLHIFSNSNIHNHLIGTYLFGNIWTFWKSFQNGDSLPLLLLAQRMVWDVKIWQTLSQFCKVIGSAMLKGLLEVDR